MIKISKDLQNLSNIVSQKTKLYIVGGFIRNILLKEQAHDIDLCSCLTLEELEQILSKTNFKITNQNYKCGTCKIKGESIYEYSTFRKDEYKEDGSHFPTNIIFIKDIYKDSQRRDFTINALYYDIKENKIIDFYNALNDVENKVLKAIPEIDNTLKFDSERILRMVKFTVKYNLTIEKETLNCAIKYSKNIKTLSNTIIKKFIKEIYSLSNEQIENAKHLLKKLNYNISL